MKKDFENKNYSKQFKYPQGFRLSNAFNSVMPRWFYSAFQPLSFFKRLRSRTTTFRDDLITKVWQRGFTLIELLVVVLIIGILAAVALPQYTVAVEKARAAEALMIMRQMRDAVSRYILAHEETRDGTYTNPNNWDIDFSGEWMDSGCCGPMLITKNFVYLPQDDMSGVTACRYKGNKPSNSDFESEYDLFMEYLEVNSDPETVCFGKTDLGIKVCKSLGGKKQGTWNHYVLP